jgi:cytidine deaminase
MAQKLKPNSKIKDLWKKACSVQKRSYSPYSKYSVGAALLGKSGRVFTGTNVENASYGATICAERSAVLKAISEGERSFVAICVVVRGHAVPPCALCLQVLSEFVEGDFQVWTGTPRSLGESFRLDSLLPKRFGPKDLS